MTPDEPTPALVTVDVFGVPVRRLPSALSRMTGDARAIRRMPGALFAKTVGTSRGRTFGPRDADPTHWGIVASWRSQRDAASFRASALMAAWQRIAHEHWGAELTTLSARGTWSRRRPFGDGRPASDGRPDADGPVAALTRARLRPRQMVRFWRTVPSVAVDLRTRRGLLFVMGLGEAPIGLQGTFSLWESESALRDFAYAGDAHCTAIRRTHEHRWYAEELFARFALVSAYGTVHGVDPLA